MRLTEWVTCYTDVGARNGDLKSYVFVSAVGAMQSYRFGVIFWLLIGTGFAGEGGYYLERFEGTPGCTLQTRAQSAYIIRLDNHS
jgi:hypothetical protein